MLKVEAAKCLLFAQNKRKIDLPVAKFIKIKMVKTFALVAILTAIAVAERDS